MKNLYVYRDVVSGNVGCIFEAENDAVMRRGCIPAMASVDPLISRDTVVLQIGTVDFDLDNMPVVAPCVPVVKLSGASPEVDDYRVTCFSSSVSSEGVGDSDEE